MGGNSGRGSSFLSLEFRVIERCQSLYVRARETYLSRSVLYRRYSSHMESSQRSQTARPSPLASLNVRPLSLGELPRCRVTYLSIPQISDGIQYDIVHTVQLICWATDNWPESIPTYGTAVVGGMLVVRLYVCIICCADCGFCVETSQRGTSGGRRELLENDLERGYPA